MTFKQRSFLTIVILSTLTLSNCSTIKSWEEEARANPTPKAVNTESAASPLDIKYINKEGKMVTKPQWMDQPNPTFKQPWSDPNKMTPNQYEKYLHDSGNILPSVPRHKK